MARETMPPRDQVDRDFDGHPERPFSALTAEERLDWVWECMVLLHAGREQRARGDGPRQTRHAPPLRREGA